jgi:hypothetical protein
VRFTDADYPALSCSISSAYFSAIGRAVTVAARAGLQRDGVRAVGGPGQGERADRRPRQLGRLPVLVDRGQHLLVYEPPGGDEVIPLLVSELLADLE